MEIDNDIAVSLVSERQCSKISSWFQLEIITITITTTTIMSIFFLVAGTVPYFGVSLRI